MYNLSPLLVSFVRYFLFGYYVRIVLYVVMVGKYVKSIETHLKNTYKNIYKIKEEKRKLI